MAFWKYVGNIANSVAKTAIKKYDEHNENVEKELTKLSRNSDEALIRKAKSGSLARKFAARKLLKERGVTQ
jgi:hypothetical protein